MSNRPQPQVLTFADADTLVTAAADALVGEIAGAVAARGVAHVVLTGGGAGINLARRLRGRREQPVERRHAVDLGGRHVEARSDLVHRAAADPPDTVVQRVEHREQQVALRAGLVTAAHDGRVGGRRRRAEHGIDRGRLLGGGDVGAELDVHVRSDPACRSGRRRP